MRLPQFSSILYSDFPSNKPSSYWLLGYLHLWKHPCTYLYIHIYIENVCARANMADGLSNYPTIFGNPGIGQY